MPLNFQQNQVKTYQGLAACYHCSLESKKEKKYKIINGNINRIPKKFASNTKTVFFSLFFIIV
ncbi:hypothetical protein pgond44_00880 [Psychroflexus gondwanensis ACAM 44]|uniref:Uncharacterized protein n=1 Tax=Psychroflexus gondwanensis ACAM 44 TaxID=1189619 RepID=N1WZX1_9FLAO|nr:hypothetical protein pgond44_00880 [Psychroflexus gondwanensis ACAM 44]